MTYSTIHPPSNRYFLGVDGGGSKTLAIVVDTQGQERGHGLAGSSNYNTVGINSAVKQLYTAVEQAAQAAGCAPPFQAAWFGLAGMDRPDDYDKLLPYLRSLAKQIHLTNDAELLLSVLAHGVGVALISGTGSIALGRDAHGATARAGGWGHILGDEGSGYTIGRQALQAAVRAADGRGAPTILLDLILNEWKLRQASDIIARVYADESRAAIAQLSSLAFKAAHAGDEPARQIIQQAAHELALAALAVGNALDFHGGRLPLALGGGILVHETTFRMQVLRRIRSRREIGPVVIVEQPALSAARAILKIQSADDAGKMIDVGRASTG